MVGGGVSWGGYFLLPNGVDGSETGGDKAGIGERADHFQNQDVVFLDGPCHLLFVLTGSLGPTK